MKAPNLHDVFIFGAGALVGGLVAPYIMFAAGELIGYTETALLDLPDTAPRAYASTSSNIEDNFNTVDECVQQGGNRKCCKAGAISDNAVPFQVTHNCILCNHPDCTNRDVDATFHPII